MNWIDLRDELNILINGGIGAIPQGYWSIIRIFRIGQLSQYWKEETNEAVGGPKYLYDDHLMRIISMPGNLFSKIESIKSGISEVIGALKDDKDIYVFAIHYNPAFSRPPMENDIIYHIDKYASVNRPTPPFRAVERFKVVNKFNEYGDFGRAEITYCIGVKEHGES
jgi:hypothetical protein